MRTSGAGSASSPWPAGTCHRAPTPKLCPAFSCEYLGPVACPPRGTWDNAWRARREGGPLRGGTSGRVTISADPQPPGSLAHLTLTFHGPHGAIGWGLGGREGPTREEEPGLGSRASVVLSPGNTGWGLSCGGDGPSGGIGHQALQRPHAAPPSMSQRMAVGRGGPGLGGVRAWGPSSGTGTGLPLCGLWVPPELRGTALPSEDGAPGLAPECQDCCCERQRPGGTSPEPSQASLPRGPGDGQLCSRAGVRAGPAGMAASCSHLPALGHVRGWGCALLSWGRGLDAMEP